MEFIDLNSDLGESFGAYRLGMDREILKHISTANIACGFHAGDPLIMDKTVRSARDNNVSVGAHPGFPDLNGFGRRKMDVSLEELEAMVIYQVSSLIGFARKYGVKVNHVKPHGAMYNMAAKDMEMARAIAKAVKVVDSNLILIGLSGSCLVKAGEEIKLKVCNEVFADRAYSEDGSLVARGVDGAVIHDSNIAISRVLKMVKEGKVNAINGKEIAIKVDSICVHGDNPQALKFVQDIVKCLSKENIEIRSY